MRRATTALAALLVAALLSTSAPVSAQDTPQERQNLAAARALFDEGAAFYEAGDLASAADRFRRSLELREVAPVQYNLATVLERLGQLVEARELFLAVARSEMPEAVRAQARQTAETIEARLAHLTVRIVNGPPSVLSLGERRLEAAMIDVAVPVDPGTYTLRGETEDGRRSSAPVELAAGAREEITLTFAPQAAVSEVALPPGSAAAGSEDALVWGIVLGVVGAVLIGGAIGLGVFLEQDRYYSGNLGNGRVSLP